MLLSLGWPRPLEWAARLISLGAHGGQGAVREGWEEALVTHAFLYARLGAGGAIAGVTGNLQADGAGRGEACVVCREFPVSRH